MMVMSLITISAIAITAVSLVILGGVYAYRSYTSRRRRQQQTSGQNEGEDGKKDKDKPIVERKKRQIVAKESSRSNAKESVSESTSDARISGVNESSNDQVNIQAVVHNESQEVKSPEESKLNEMKERMNESIVECNQDVSQSSGTNEDSNNTTDRSRHLLPITDGRLVRSCPKVGDENIEPAEGSFKWSGTMSTGSFGQGSWSPTSGGQGSSGNLDSGNLDSGNLDSGNLDSGNIDSGNIDSGNLDSICGQGTRLTRRSRIPRKIRDIEPDPRDAGKYKTVKKSSPRNGGFVSPGVSFPSPVSLKSRDTLSPLTSSSSRVERSPFQAKQIRG